MLHKLATWRLSCCCCWQYHTKFFFKRGVKVRGKGGRQEGIGLSHFVEQSYALECRPKPSRHVGWGQRDGSAMREWLWFLLLFHEKQPLISLWKRNFRSHWMRLDGNCSWWTSFSIAIFWNNLPASVQSGWSLLSFWSQLQIYLFQ